MKINMNEVLLKNGIELQRFDGIEGENTYLVLYQNRKWKVSVLTADIINILQKTGSVDESITVLKLKYPNIDLDVAIEHTISLLKSNGLIIGYQVDQRKDRKKFIMWGRITLIPASYVLKLKFFCILFFKPVMCLLSIVSSIWVIYALLTVSAYEISQQILQLPLPKILICYVLIFSVGLLHEIGHSSALMFCGEKPSRIGVAFYLASPVLFSDVTNAWKLNRKQRCVVDYGGIYFQSFFSGLIYIVNLIWLKSNILSIVAFFEALLIVGNFNPFFKYDGYWMLSDLMGTTNMTDIVINFWKSIFVKRQLCIVKDKSIKYKLILVSYSIGCVLYFAYFINLLMYAVVSAMYAICCDINFAIYKGINLSYYNIIKYIMNRFANYLILIIVSIMIVRLLMKLLSFFRKGKKHD